MEARKLVLLPANMVCLCGSNLFFHMYHKLKNCGCINSLLISASTHTSELLKGSASPCPLYVFVLRLKPSMRVPENRFLETECCVKPLLAKLNAYIKLWLFEIHS
jgi:hypothetical protein